jgi:rare lipoprotein A
MDRARRGPAGIGVALLVGMALLAGCARPRAVVTAPVTRPTVGHEEVGLASWYGVPYHGRRTASGEIYDMHQMTAAHRSLPFGTWLAVENRSNGRVAELRVNDRGPFVDGRILDLSYGAARVLDGIGPGVIPVRLRVIAPPAGTPPPAAFVIQVSAFTDESRATAVQRQLAEQGFAARVETGGAPDGSIVYRVRVGRFADVQHAAQEAGRLEAATGRAVLVVRE